MGRRTIVVGIVVAVAASGASSCDRDRHLPMPSPSTAPAPRSTSGTATSNITAAVGDAGLGSRIAVLDAPGGSDEAKVAMIESLGSDHSEAVTGVLLRFVNDPSTLIAAASIKGLTGRGCDRVQTALVGLLNDEDWQRRAWAAKVLGTNRCRGAESALGDRVRREGDERVKARLEEARQLLGEPNR